MSHIAYFTEFSLQICDYVQKRRICRENRINAFDENFHGHFCPRRKAVKFCHPAGTRLFFNTRPEPARYWKNLPIGPSGCSKFIQRGHQIIKSAFRHKKGNWQKLLAASFIVGKTCRCVCAIFQAGRANFLLVYVQNILWTLVLASWALALIQEFVF